MDTTNDFMVGMAMSGDVAAKANGWDGETEGMLDYLDVHPKRSKEFETKETAETWLKEEINGMKSLFGCGDITTLERVKRRCRYCVCNGYRSVSRAVVEDDGIVQEDTCDDDCLDDD